MEACADVQPAAKAPRPNQWTPDQAREMARKREEARRARKEAQDANGTTPQRTQTPRAPRKPAPSQDVTSAITRTRQQLAAVDAQLDQCDDPRAWDALTRAKERLWRVLAHAANIPGPGNLKPVLPRVSRGLLGGPSAVPVAQPITPPASQPVEESSEQSG
jgi:hypothetical protein